MKIIVCVALIAVLVLTGVTSLNTTSALAQNAAPITGPPFVARAVLDRLDIGNRENDHVEPGLTSRRAYRLVLGTQKKERANSGLQIDAPSQNIDTVLKAYYEGESTPFADDDNSGGGTDARLVLRPDQLKRPIIVVVTERTGQGGRFFLSALWVDAPRPVPVVPLNGLTITSAIKPSSPRREGLGQPYEPFTITVSQRQRVKINVTASGFDPTAELYLGESLIARDADSGPGANSQLVRTLGPGEYTLTVLAPEKSTGSFTISSTTLGTPPGIGNPVVLAGPANVNYEFNENTPVMAVSERPDQPDRPYALYLVSGKAGQRWLVTLKPVSDGATDPQMVLESGALTAAGFATLSRRTASQPSFVIPFSSDGDVLLRVIGSLDWFGNYNLNVTPAP